MKASEAFDRTYTRQPGWFVGHRHMTPDDNSPNLPTKGNLRPGRRSIFLTTSIVVGAILVVFLANAKLSAADGDQPEQGRSSQHTHQASVSIDGKSVAIPPDGTIHQMSTTATNNSTVDISIQDTSTN